jgi:hypothetical protein
MHGGKTPQGWVHPRFKDGRHCTYSLFSIGVKLCPKCRKKHGTKAECERRERAMDAKFLRGYVMGRKHGYSDGHHDGFNAGQDAAWKAAAQRRGPRPVVSKLTKLTL